MRLAACLSTLAAVALAAPAGAAARDFRFTSFDGTRIQAHFMPAGEGQAPTVLIGPGWGSGGSNDAEQPTDVPNGIVGVGPLRRAGYNVLTWDPRGFGDSGGEAKLDSPHFEARDVQRLIDELARLPEAQLDAAGDPRVGMAGASYGGGIQWVTAAIDSRLDAIAPDIAWHSLESSLVRDGVFKAGWGSFLCGLGAAQGTWKGLVNPEGIQAGSMDRRFYSTCESGLATGGVAASDRAWLAERGPGSEWMSRVRAPTLLLHGTVDTLFTPSEALANYAVLRGQGVPLRMMWFCGGHGTCSTRFGPGRYVEAAVLRWFDRWLKGDERADVGPGFEWVDQDGQWRSAPSLPLDPVGSLQAVGSGRLGLVSGDPRTSGTTVAATPASNGLNVNLDRAGSDADLVGEPVLELDYSGTGTPADAHVFAQIVDLDRNIVVGGQVTPIPVRLDGTGRSVRRNLEALAYRVTPGTRLQLQLISGSLVYGQPRAAGSVDFSRIALSAPLGKPGPVESSGGRTKPRCKPRLRPRRVKARRLGRVSFRPRLRCGKRKLERRLVITGGVRAWRGRSGRRVRVRVLPGTRRLKVRYRYAGRARGARIRVVR